MTVSADPASSYKLQSLCVFCGASAGNRDAYREAATALGSLIAGRGMELIYGGGNVGLMGVVANACLDAGGRVTGVIPASLVGREVAGEPVEHTGLTRLEIVDSMHARKARMAQLADGFIALPGGFGTFEELFEILTWAQLGFHRKPIGLLDVAGYFEPLRMLCDRAVNEGFLPPDNRELLLIASHPTALLGIMGAYQPPASTAWVKSQDEL